MRVSASGSSGHNRPPRYSETALPVSQQHGGEEESHLPPWQQQQQQQGGPAKHCLQQQQYYGMQPWPLQPGLWQGQQQQQQWCWPPGSNGTAEHSWYGYGPAAAMGYRVPLYFMPYYVQPPQ